MSPPNLWASWDSRNCPEILSGQWGAVIPTVLWQLLWEQLHSIAPTATGSLLYKWVLSSEGVSWVLGRRVFEAEPSSGTSQKGSHGMNSFGCIRNWCSWYTLINFSQGWHTACSWWVMRRGEEQHKPFVLAPLKCGMKRNLPERNYAILETAKSRFWEAVRI